MATGDRKRMSAAPSTREDASESRLDIMIVPDFLGHSRRVFEYTSALFLASWLETGCQHEDCQLHVVCVGEPPTIIRALCEQAKGQLTVAEPFPGPDRFRNKLRGLEVKPTADRFLLLDTDVVLFSPISEIVKYLPPPDISLDYGGASLSVAQWRIVYEHFGLRLPERRVAIADAPLASQTLREHPLRGEFSASVPYFNAGVVAAPWASGLARLWVELIDEVPDILRSAANMGAVAQQAFYDQPPLAVAVHMLERQGHRIRILPRRLHVRWKHVCVGFISAEDALLVHNTGIFKNNPDASLAEEIAAYAERTRTRMSARNGTPGQNARMAAFAEHLEGYLLDLQRRWIDRYGGTSD